jgi:hypothetical protein
MTWCCIQNLSIHSGEAQYLELCLRLRVSEEPQGGTPVRRQCEQGKSSFQGCWKDSEREDRRSYDQWTCV